MTPAGVVTQFPPVPVLRSATQIGTAAVEVRLRCPARSPGQCRGAIVLDHAENGGRPHRRAVPLFGWRPASGAR